MFVITYYNMQNKYLFYVVFILNIGYPRHDYSFMWSMLNILTFSSHRRHDGNILFILY